MWKCYSPKKHIIKEMCVTFTILEIIASATVIGTASFNLKVSVVVIWIPTTQVCVHVKSQILI